jgi:hypothetical protein
MRIRKDDNTFTSSLIECGNCAEKTNRQPVLLHRNKKRMIISGYILVGPRILLHNYRFFLCWYIFLKPISPGKSRKGYEEVRTENCTYILVHIRIKQWKPNEDILKIVWTGLTLTPPPYCSALT